MERAVWVDVYPISSLDGSGPIEFCFMGTQDEYLDLNDTMLYVKMKVTKTDGTDLGAASVATPANLTLAALFSDISLSMNDTSVDGGNFLYPYKSMMASLLQFDGGMKATQLEAAGYNEIDATRKGWIAASKSHEFLGPLHLDMFAQSKYLLPGVNVRVKLSRSKLNFVIQNNGVKDDVKLVMEKVCLYVRKVKVNSTVLTAHEDGMEKGSNAIYPIQQSDMLCYTIPVGSSYHMQDNLFRGQMPKMIVIGLVGMNAFNGDAKDDPLKFKHFNVNYLNLQRDGESVPYTQPLQTDFGNQLVGKAYMSMIQNLEMYNTNTNNGITMAKFIDGYTLFAFNLTPDLSAGGSCGQPYQTGNLRLELKFDAALTEGINVIMMALRDGRIEITKNRQVLKS
jgi:hypothetical protein